MNDPETTSPVRELPWLKIVLFASLALNLLVLGVFIGSRVSGEDTSKEHSRKKGGPVGMAVGPYGRALSKEDRRAMGEAFLRRSQELRGHRQNMRALGAQVVAALRATPFDSGKVAELLEEQVVLGRRLQVTGQELLVERIEAMSPEARTAFADRLEEMLKRGPRKPKRGQ